MPTDCISMHAKNVMAMYENMRLKISIEPINISFPDATNEILEPLKSPSNDKNLETSDGGSRVWYGAMDMKN